MYVVECAWCIGACMNELATFISTIDPAAECRRSVDALRTTVRSQFRKRGAVLGLSGGIDHRCVLVSTDVWGGACAGRAAARTRLQRRTMHGCRTRLRRTWAFVPK